MQEKTKYVRNIRTREVFEDSGKPYEFDPAIWRSVRYLNPGTRFPRIIMQISQLEWLTPEECRAIEEKRAFF